MNKFKTSLVFLFLLLFNLTFFNLLEAQETIPDLPSKASGISLSENFSGVWEGTKINSANSSECMLCTQVVPECGPNEKLILQTCDECAHCIDSSSSGLQKFFKQTNKKIAMTIKLKLCVKSGKLEGVVKQDGVIDDAEIRSQSLISKNKVFVVLLDKKGKTTTLILELVDEKKLLITVSDGKLFEAVKISPYKKCIGT